MQRGCVKTRQTGQGPGTNHLDDAMHGHPKRPVAGLTLRIVTALLFASLLPLAITGVGSWIVFARLLKDRTLELQQAIVNSHAQAIEHYIGQRVRALELVSRAIPIGVILEQNGLQRVFEDLNSAHDDAFVDLGVIGRDGSHLAYIGPYDLMDKNYSSTRWFKDAMQQGSYVSDVFMGFRGVPHCVIAVRGGTIADPWMLRATINGDDFDSLVRSAGSPGGDAYIINNDGLYQTTPAVGQILARSPVGRPGQHRGVRHERVLVDSKPFVRTSTWLRDGRWMLVVEQSEAHIQAPLRRAMLLGSIVVLMAVVFLVVTIVVATRHLTSRIDRANARTEKLYRDLVRSAKLASLGELATGLAHEINNPLAIIGTEQTNISDVILECDPRVPCHDDVIESVNKCQRQVMRCKAITTKMLQFGRQGTSRPVLGDVGGPLAEIVELIGRQARLNNVDLRLSVEPGLPPVLLDRTELEQVIVNLVNNSMQAISVRGTVIVSARRDGDEVLVSVADDGSGISPSDLEWIFEPFFTTKDVGKGTGLGLAVCYGVVRSWGGRIEATSDVGKGTTMTIHLPVRGAGHDTVHRQEATA